MTNDEIEKIAREELDSILSQARAKGNVTQDGVWVMTQLKKLGWVSLSDTKNIGSSFYRAKHSALFHEAGYRGGYNHCKLVKINNNL